VGSDRRPLAVSAGGFYFVAPDNGLLSFLFRSGDPFKAFEISDNQYLSTSPSSTFHGRDIFAPAAGLIAGGADPEDLGLRVMDPVILPHVDPHPTPDGRIAGRVQHIDRFGNIVTNIRSQGLSGEFEIVLNGHTIDRFHPFFADAGYGEVFAISGSAGFIEIAVRDGSAASELGVSTGDEVLLVQQFKKPDTQF
jgi:S-adenosylmethionine hydrolase